MSRRDRRPPNAATSEAARRALMQPVTCWEKKWSSPDNAGVNSPLKYYKWVRTDKKQQFSDDEEDSDMPIALAPLPDEENIAEGDEDMDQDLAPTAAASREVSEPLSRMPPAEENDPSLPPPSDHLALPAATPAALLDEETTTALDEALKPLDDTLDPTSQEDIDKPQLTLADDDDVKHDLLDSPELPDATLLLADDSVLPEFPEQVP